VYLQCDCSAILNEEERVADVALADDSVPGFEADGLESVCDLGALVGVETGEDVDLGEEGLVAVALADSRILHDVGEGVAVERPEDAVGLRADRGHAGRVVEESELAEGLAGVVCLEKFLGRRGVGAFVALEVSLFHDEHLVAGSSLLDDDFSSLEAFLFHGVDDDLFVLGVERGEHEVACEALVDVLELIVGLSNYLR